MCDCILERDTPVSSPLRAHGSAKKTLKMFPRLSERFESLNIEDVLVELVEGNATFEAEVGDATNLE
jgi:hypothetical protein